MECKYYYKGEKIMNLLNTKDYQYFLSYFHRHKELGVDKVYEYVKNGKRPKPLQKEIRCLYKYKGKRVVDLLSYVEYSKFAKYMYNHPEKSVEECYEFIKNESENEKSKWSI